MAELADAIDLGSIVNRRAGSSPVIRTISFDCMIDVFRQKNKCVIWGKYNEYYNDNGVIFKSIL